MVDVDVVFSSEVLLRFEVRPLGTLGGGIISMSSGVEIKGSVWYGVSESTLPDCRPLLAVIKPSVLAESLSVVAELLVVWVPAYSVVQSVSAPEVGRATHTKTTGKLKTAVNHTVARPQHIIPFCLPTIFSSLIPKIIPYHFCDHSFLSETFSYKSTTNT